MNGRAFTHDCIQKAIHQRKMFMQKKRKTQLSCFSCVIAAGNEISSILIVRTSKFSNGRQPSVCVSGEFFWNYMSLK